MRNFKLLASLLMTTATIGLSTISAYAYQNATFSNEVTEESINNIGKYTFSVESNTMNYGPGSIMKLGNIDELEGNASYIMDDVGNIKLVIDNNGFAVDGLSVDGLLYGIKCIKKCHREENMNGINLVVEELEFIRETS